MFPTSKCQTDQASVTQTKPENFYPSSHFLPNYLPPMCALNSQFFFFPF